MAVLEPNLLLKQGIGPRLPRKALDSKLLQPGGGDGQQQFGGSLALAEREQLFSRQRRRGKRIQQQNRRGVAQRCQHVFAWQRNQCLAAGRLGLLVGASPVASCAGCQPIDRFSFAQPGAGSRRFVGWLARLKPNAAQRKAGGRQRLGSLDERRALIAAQAAAAGSQPIHPPAGAMQSAGLAIGRNKPWQQARFPGFPGRAVAAASPANTTPWGRAAICSPAIKFIEEALLGHEGTFFGR